MKELLSVLSMIIFCAFCFNVNGQTTGFTYQGRLTEASITANGTYQMQFSLFDAIGGGTQQGSTITNNSVTVTNGVFTVQLDFTAAPFATGADRFIEINVKKPADAGFTTLTPRQRLTSAPYAVKSLNAANADVATNSTQLGGVAANQYTQTNDPRLTDERTPTAGSANYIQNSATQQTASNFNISGNGTAGGTLSGNVVNAATQFNLGGNRVLAISGTTGLLLNSNTFAGVGAGANTIPDVGNFNSFFGNQAGQANTTGSFNVFSGRASGRDNTTGVSNSFFGASAGLLNTTGGNNTFVGVSAGQGNTTGGNNAFVGVSAGANNTTGGFNTFIGLQAGQNVTTGSGNVFIGNDTGLSNRTGNSNTAIGSGANVTESLSFATAIGSQATVSTSNTIVLGRGNGGDGVFVPGPLFASGGLNLNDTQLRLRGGADPNHAISFNPNFDGIEFRANAQFVWSRANGNLTQMSLNNNGVLATRGGFNGKCVDTFIGAGNCNQDLAETFRTKEQTEAGDVVTLIPQDHERPTVRRSLRAYDEHLVGVVSTNPGLVFDEGDTRLAGANDHYITKDKTVVAAVGRVPVKFTLENGAINVGDPLTSSATEPGKAMKATGAGKIIGLALESSDKAQLGATPDRLLMWLQVGQNSTYPAGASSNADKAENTELKAQIGQLKTETAAMKQFICSQTPTAPFCKKEEK